jgi:thiol-disulfide isomerase/thioredoxin
MKKILISICLLLIYGSVVSQSVKKIKMDELLHLMNTCYTPLVINFWASWCGPCVREIPWFEKNVQEMKGKKIKLILVSLDFADEFPKGIAGFARKNGYQSEIYWLNETNTDEFCPKIDKSWDGTIPVTMMVNNKKKYRKFFGQQIPEKRLQLELQQLID